MTRTVCAWAITLLTAPAAMASTGPAAAGPSFSDQVRDTLGLHRCAIVDVEIEAAASAPLEATIEIDGVPWRLALTPRSVRAPEYTVYAATADGTLTAIEPGAVRTLRGHVRGQPQSLVAATRSGQSLTAMIELGDGRRWWLEPVAALPGATSTTQHALYEERDVKSGAGTCAAGAHHDFLVEAGPAAPASPPPPLGADGGTPAVAELACDADYDFYLSWGEGTEDRINAIINQVNVQFERDVAITHEITAIIIRTEPLYTATDAWLLVNQFRNRWLGNHALVPRDVAHLFTGKDMDGNTIGIAYDIGRICTTGAYCVSQSDHSGGFACSTDLTAHELGHLWGAGHCTCPTFTMNPVITCANQFTTATITDVIAHRDTRDCLNVSDPTTYCAAFSASTSFEYVARVQTGSIDHSSGATGYSIFTDISTEVDHGAAYPITITLGEGYFGDAGGAWIDWNADGDFEDDGEVIATTFTGAGPYIGGFVVPEDAVAGATRLRVRVQDAFSDPFVSPCGTTDFGEVEDYTVIVVGPPPCPEDIDGSGDVGFTDLLAVLGFWGPCAPDGPCDPDVDGSGDVGFTDLLAIMSAWGPC